LKFFVLFFFLSFHFSPLTAKGTPQQVFYEKRLSATYRFGSGRGRDSIYHGGQRSMRLTTNFDKKLCLFMG
jgi:hypothetical protein